MILGFLVLNNPEAEAQMSYAHALSLCHVIQRSLARNSVGSLPQGYCEKNLKSWKDDMWCSICIVN